MSSLLMMRTMDVTFLRCMSSLLNVIVMKHNVVLPPCCVQFMLLPILGSLFGQTWSCAGLVALLAILSGNILNEEPAVESNYSWMEISNLCESARNWNYTKLFRSVWNYVSSMQLRMNFTQRLWTTWKVCDWESTHKVCVWGWTLCRVCECPS